MINYYISGVADQLQSNFASDLRNILKSVFELHTGEDDCQDKSKAPRITDLTQCKYHQEVEVQCNYLVLFQETTGGAWRGWA